MGKGLNGRTKKGDLQRLPFPSFPSVMKLGRLLKSVSEESALGVLGSFALEGRAMATAKSHRSKRKMRSHRHACGVRAPSGRLDGGMDEDRTILPFSKISPGKLPHRPDHR